MVERCARAAHDAREELDNGEWDRVAWERTTNRNRAEADFIARAVIEALMEPTKPMLFFGMDAMARDDLEPTEDEFRAGFVAALRAALGDQFAALSQPNDEGDGK